MALIILKIVLYVSPICENFWYIIYNIYILITNNISHLNVVLVKKLKWKRNLQEMKNEKNLVRSSETTRGILVELNKEKEFNEWLAGLIDGDSPLKGGIINNGWKFWNNSKKIY
jgi:hypothetical protein